MPKNSERKRGQRYEQKFYGYERPDGSVGIRNYILVLSMVNCSNTVAQQIAAETGAHVIPIDCGCVEVADHHRRTCLALTSAALNPNVYAVILVGLGCEQTDHDKIMADIAASGKPVSYIGIQESGGPRPAVAKGVEIAEKYQAAAAPCPWKNFRSPSWCWLCSVAAPTGPRPSPAISPSGR